MVQSFHSSIGRKRNANCTDGRPKPSVSSENMELLIWHEALGSDDEQATEEERVARLLYAHTAEGRDERSVDEARARGMHSLQFMEALVAFTRLLRRQQAPGHHWISVLLSKRRFYVREVEPQIYVALCIGTAALSGKDLRHVHQAVLTEVYELLRLFHGTIDVQLRKVPSDLSVRFSDGMEMLRRIGAVRRQLRKIGIALELHEHDFESSKGDTQARTSLEEERLQLETELEVLLRESPSRLLWERCDSFLPKLLHVMGVGQIDMFHEVDGVAYFPMDETVFLSFQTLVNTLQAELRNIIDGGIALFYKGNMLWTTIDSRTSHLLQRFLRLREQDGMDVNSAPQPQTSLWMGPKYDDAFSPIWASKTTYAESAIVTHVASQPRSSTKSIHKYSPASLNAVLNELLDSSEDKQLSKVQSTIRGQRYRTDAPVYRNRGFLTSSGYFLPSWELAKPDSEERVWAPEVFYSNSGDAGQSSSVLVYHENDMSILLLVRSDSSSNDLLKDMGRMEDCLEKVQFPAMATAIWQRYLAMTGNSPSRDKASSSQPPAIYLNRVNLAFKVSDLIPRLVKSKEIDLFPRPASLWGRYLPSPSLSLLNDAHANLNNDPDSLELWVKTVNDGWLFASRSGANKRELYTMLDTKAASVADAQDAISDLVETHFSNIYL